MTDRTAHPWVAWIADPRSVSALSAAAWASVTLAGIGALRYGPPSSIATELGPWLTLAWVWLYITGGALAVIGALPGWWYLERAGITLLVIGLIIYGGVVWTLHHTTPGNRAPQGFIVVALICAAAARFARITGSALDPARGPGAPPLTHLPPTGPADHTGHTDHPPR